MRADSGLQGTGLRNISHKLLCFLKRCTTVQQNTVHVHVRCHHCETDGKLLCVGVWYQWKFIIASLWDCSGGRGASDNQKYRAIFFQPELCFPHSPISFMCRINSIICQWCVHCYHGCIVLCGYSFDGAAEHHGSTILLLWIFSQIIHMHSTGAQQVHTVK